jgi:hypothetical protein
MHFSPTSHYFLILSSKYSHHLVLGGHHLLWTVLMVAYYSYCCWIPGSVWLSQYSKLNIMFWELDLFPSSGELLWASSLFVSDFHTHIKQQLNYGFYILVFRYLGRWALLLISCSKITDFYIIYCNLYTMFFHYSLITRHWVIPVFSYGKSLSEVAY